MCYKLQQRQVCWRFELHTSQDAWQAACDGCGITSMPDPLICSHKSHFGVAESTYLEQRLTVQVYKLRTQHRDLLQDEYHPDAFTC